MSLSYPAHPGRSCGARAVGDGPCADRLQTG